MACLITKATTEALKLGRCTEQWTLRCSSSVCLRSFQGERLKKITGSQWHKSFVCMAVGAKPGSHAVNAKTCSQSNHSKIHRQIRLLTLLLGGAGALYQNTFICFPTSNRTLLTYTFRVLKFVISDSFCKSSNLLCWNFYMNTIHPCICILMYID